MRPSRRTLTTRNRDLAARLDKALDRANEAEKGEKACAHQLLLTSAELSRAKDVIASHLVHAGHPSTVLHDVHSFATSLRQALTDAGVDLRAELALMEGVDL